VKKLSLVFMLILSFSMGFAQVKDSSSQGKEISPWWVERFRLSAGFFESITNTTIQVSVNGSDNGTPIDFEKDLGLGASFSTFLTNFQWRISRRSRFNVGYFNMKRSATHTLQKDIRFDSTTYPANTVVDAYFNTSILQFSYGYAIVQKPTYEIGLSLGAHTIGTKVGFRSNDNNGGLSTDNNFGFTAPLPNLGVWGGYAFSKRFAVNLDFSYLSLTFNNVYGRILAYNLLFTYQLIRQLDLSLAYTGLNFKVKKSKENLDGNFSWGYNGPTIIASFSFGGKSWIHE
jgi:hypothetical protein